MTGDTFVLPTSSTQQRLWMLDRLAPGQATYNVAWSLRLTGALDASALAAALSWLVARHEALRTCFTAVDGEPVQLVGPPRPVELPVTDLSGRGGSSPGHDSGRPGQLAALVQAAAREPFDLARGPLLRVRLVRLAEAEHVLILVVHHAIVDGWSFGTIFPELAHAYQAIVDGGTPQLPPPPIQYGDFALWQREQAERGAFGVDLDFWRDQLAGAPTLLDLPTDRPRPPEQSPAGGMVTFPIPAELAAAVRRLAEREQATGFAVLLAAFQALLHRLSGQSDLLVGVPVSGRTRPETRAVVGFFANTLALRARFEPTGTFTDLLRAARDSAVAAASRQDVPFERVVDLLAPERSLAYPPVVQVMFALDELPAPTSAAGVTFHPELVENGTVKFDLTLTVEQAGDRLHGRLTYRAELFEPTRMRQLTEAYLALLTGAVAAPQHPVAELPVLAEATRALIRTRWRQATVHAPPYRSVADLLAARPAADPDAVAVAAPDGERTYRELTAEAARLAHLLIAEGAGPDRPVGICLSRGHRMVTAILATWLAGAPYLPLDPELPVRRLADMADEARTRLVLTDPVAATATGPIWPAGARVLRLAGDPELTDRLARLPAQPPTPTAHADHLAYLLYTSGSTGTPKAVAVTQGGVVNLLLSFDRLLGLGPADRMAAITTPAFDISVVELILPLLAGARVEIIEPGVARDATALRAELVARRITVAQGTPATWRMLVTAGGVPATVRTRISGGEALTRELADALRGDDARVINGYGPSETTIYSSAGTVAGAGAVDLGSEVANTRLYLLDPAGQPVGPGFVGELHIGGLGLARGYHRRPGLTAARLLPDPDSPLPGARRYATGDLARALPDGRLEFVGRADHQVKLRGYRIELGEIEAALRAEPEIADAVVTAWRCDAEDVRLVGYVLPVDAVPAGERAQLPDRLRPALARRLPEYMVPAAFVVLDRLPRTASGKLDRAALPEPTWRQPTEAPPTVPRTPQEAQLAGLWAEVLGLTEVGIDDNFFALGGHSLTATRLIARIRAAFGVDLPLRALFATPTVAGLAQQLTGPAGGDGPGNGPGPAGGGPAGAAPEELLATLDTLSDQEIDDLLDSLIAEEGTR